MADQIVVTGIRGKGFHGVLDFEKRDGQEFTVDVVLDVDLAAAGESDALDQTVNYAEVAADVVARIEGPSFDLIERLAAVIAQDALTRPLVEAVSVTIHKPHAPVGVPFDDVQVRIRRERVMVPFVVALGANLGDAAATVEAAAQTLDGIEGIIVGDCSGLWETAPVGGPEQPAYTNAVLTGRTRMTPRHLLRVLNDIEADHGRTREIRWGARTLDLDLIQYGVPGEASEVRSDDPVLTLPHPRAHERGFVLHPWLEADPQAMLRVGDDVLPVADLAAAVGDGGLRAIDADETAGCACGAGGCGDEPAGGSDS